MPITITTTDSLDGTRVTKYLGIVRGVVVAVPTAATLVLAGISQGSKAVLEQECEEARHEACERMISLAIHIGASAVVGVRYESCTIATTRCEEVLCYGTAVITEPTR